MKLVDTDSHGPPGVDDDSAVTTPPRPERRRVAVSLVLTASVLIGTVVAIYAIFPERRNLLVTRSLELHQEPPAFQLVQPTPSELDAWGVALFDRRVPWPALPQGAQIAGASSISVLNRRAAVVRYRLGMDEVTLVAQRAREVVPRQRRRIAGNRHAVSWRKGPWTFVAVGPDDSVKRWSSVLDVP